MNETEHAQGDPLEAAFREVHGALDSLESYLKQRIGCGEASPPNPIDLLLELRRTVIARPRDPDGS